MNTLKDTLDLVSDWLKFAEAKNAVVVATSGFALWASVRLFLSNDTGCYVSTYFGILSVFILGALIVALLSFLPVLDYRWLLSMPSNVANRNLLYFGYLATLSKQELIESYISAAELENQSITDIDRMYAEQIIVNSRIASAKYAMFEISIRILLFGILTPLVALPILYFSRKQREQVNGV